MTTDSIESTGEDVTINAPGGDVPQDGGETAAATEGPGGPEPQTEDLDLSRELYELGEGDDVRKLTGQDIIDNFQAAQQLPNLQQQIQDLNAKLEAAQRQPQPPQGPQPQAGQEGPGPIQELGNNIISTLKEAVESGDGEALGNLGGSLVQLIQGIAQQNVLPQFQQEQAQERASSQFVEKHPEFNQFLQDGSLQKFMEANPFYTPGEAALEMKLGQMTNRIGELEAQVKAAEAAGFKAGAAKATKDAQTRGMTLRGIGPSGRSPAPTNKGGPKKLGSSEERRAAMAADPRLADL
jgi:hypothetical protein